MCFSNQINFALFPCVPVHGEIYIFGILLCFLWFDTLVSCSCSCFFCSFQAYFMILCMMNVEWSLRVSYYSSPIYFIIINIVDSIFFLCFLLLIFIMIFYLIWPMGIFSLARSCNNHLMQIENDYGKFATNK